MKKWLKKYSMQMAIITGVAGVLVMVLPYFGGYIPQPVIGGLMLVCGVLSGIGRVLPQLTE